MKKEGKEKRGNNYKNNNLFFGFEFLNYHINPINFPGTLHFMKGGHFLRTYK